MENLYTWLVDNDFFILVFFGTSLAGYAIGQRYKHSHHRYTSFSVATVNGIVAAALSFWIFANDYSINISAQLAVMNGSLSPILVWLLFVAADFIAPGKTKPLKSGVLFLDDDDVKTKLLKTTLAAVVGKRKDARKAERTELWTPEQRAERLKQVRESEDVTSREN